ncbi:alpha/beta hydrolase [Gordonia hydrophobica]|uniref:Alpha/beta hydrolase n=1 Tax=Gordonia hydrophobica TaxID=40516 RepID=A0ABZ2U101_9ACTN|nr:alpha/beta hydrolase [Gordonia hydrophobica]MBM7367208.1 arylformamidase [Gordonia hydrophobica]
MRPEIAEAYDTRATVSGTTFDDVMAEYRRRSDTAVAHLAGVEGIVYDRPSAQRLDIWGLGDDARPVFFVVHGGYWRMLSRQDTAFMADVLAARGVATVAIDYGLAPATALPEIVRQVRSALTWIYRNGGEHRLDTDRIIVGGSSAGAHLAATTMVPGWQESAGIPQSAVRGGLLLSGLYDLRPLVHAPANEWLYLTNESARAVSPALGTAPSTPTVIALAEREASGFVQQSTDLHQRWSDAADSRLLTVPGRNHFDVFLDLAEPTSELSRALFSLIDSTARTDDAVPTQTVPVTGAHS